MNKLATKVLNEHFLYESDHVDLFDKAEEVHDLMSGLVLNSMPDEPLIELVYVCQLPTSPEMTTVYLCETEERDKVYAFSDGDLTEIMPKYFRRYHP